MACFDQAEKEEEEELKQAQEEASLAHSCDPKRETRPSLSNK
jgi:hypothetical protein